MSERLRCLVPGCRRTFKPEPGDTEVICGKHYRLADKRLRRLITKIKRRINVEGLTERRWRQFDFAWVRVRRQAVERSLGL